MDIFACRMTCNSVDDILKCFDRLEKNGNLTLPVKNHIHILKVELRFMRIIMRWTMTWGRTCIYGHFFADIETGVRHAKKKLLQPSTEADATFLNEILSSLLENIRVQKDATKKFCLYNFRNHLNSSMSYADHVVIDELLVELLDPLLENLKYYVGCTDVDLVVLLKDQMKVLMEKLRSLIQFLKFIEKKQEMFKADEDWRKTWEMTRIQVLTENAALLSYLCWLEDMHAGIHLRSMFGDMLLKIKDIEPEIRMIYVNILKVSKKGTLLIDLGSLVAVGSLLENIEELQNLDAASLVPIEDDEIETLHQELIYLKDFLLHPPPKQYIQPEKFDYLLLQVEATAVEVGSFIHSCCHSQRKHDIAGEMLPLYHLRTNIILMKAEIKEIYLKVPKPSPSEFPRTQNLGFIDFFLQNLDDLLSYGAVSIATVENNLKTVRSELAILRNLLDDLQNLLKGSEELEDIVQHVANVAYEAECVIDFITLNDGGFWYYMLWLVDVIEKIKLLKTEITSTHDKKMQDIRYHTIEMASCLESSEDNTQVDEEVVGFEDQGKQMIEKHSYLESSQDNTLIDEEVVGFNDQAEKIIDLLQRGSQQLGIVSITGMPGLGKTTLAKKVYNDPSIKFHFHVRMWCRVSQVSERKRLLLDILHNNIGPTDRISEMTDIDLAAVLCNKLRGMKFLVVMDDVWSLEVWKDLKSSFPDDRNGSRILFTSRINDVALPANSNNTPHYLRLFKEEESWELLQKKVFPQKSCPPKLSIVGKQIAANCKGLPLSVVVVAGILRKMETEDQWKQIAESLGQHCVGEQRECMNVLELSCKHLPDHLKPCFLYFGVLLEDKEIAVQN